MSFVNAGQYIQTFVEEYGNTGRTYGVFDFVRRTSEENTKVTLDPDTFLISGGKKREVKMTYFPILCDTEGSCDTNICDTGDVIEPKQIFFNITQCTASKIFAINKNDIRYVDGNWIFTSVARSIIVSALPDMRRTLAMQMETYLYGLSGLHPDGNPEKRISVTNTATGVVNPTGKVFIETEYDEAGFTMPNILGGYEVKLWQEMQAIGGLNAQGQRIDQQSAENTWYDNGLGDRILNDLTNGSHILTIAPEMFKFVWYLENAGIFSTDLNSLDDIGLLYSRGTGGAFIEGTLIDPVTGFPWDLYIRYDECTQQWNFQIKLRWDFFVLPDVSCAGQGVNGIMRWRTCPPVIAECPTGSPLSPAQATDTFTWTPVLADIPNIFTSTIAGYTVNQNQPVAITTLNQLAAYMSDNSQIQFRVVGSTIAYDGYSAISGEFNNDVEFTFAP